MTIEEKISLYVKVMNDFQNSLDESFFGLDMETKQQITLDINDENLTLAAAEMSKYPCCIPFITHAERKIYNIQRKRNDFSDE